MSPSNPQQNVVNKIKTTDVLGNTSERIVTTDPSTGQPVGGYDLTDEDINNYAEQIAKRRVGN